MIFTGTFNTYDNQQTYRVKIGNPMSAQTVTISDPTEQGFDQHTDNIVVMFAPVPVTISCDRQDLMKRIIISQATINLVSNKDLNNELFADTTRSIPVTIELREGENSWAHVFYGYVDPLQFSQGYAHHYENITVNATDPLGALEDIIVDEDDITINRAAELSPMDLIEAILGKTGITYITTDIYSDVMDAMEDTKIQCSLFFGSDPADFYNYYDILDNICKYFNLYIAMTGKESVIITSTINNNPSEVEISSFKTLATDDSTSLSMDDVYSQVSLTCSIDPIPDLVADFTDNDLLYSDYNDYSMYMTEYVSSGKGSSAWAAFKSIINNEPTDYDASYTIDHWCYVFRNDAWDFGQNSYIDQCINSNVSTTKMTLDQRKVLAWLAQEPFRAALVGFAEMNKIMSNGVTTDNSLQQTPALKKYLVISVMGNYDSDDPEDTTAFNRYKNLISSKVGYDSQTGVYATPICSYKGVDSNVLSPANNKIVNFILINGSITLNPLQRLTGPNWGSDSAKLTNYFGTCRDSFNWGASGLSNLVMNSFGHYIEYPNEVVGGGDHSAYYNQFWHYDYTHNTPATFPTSAGTHGIYGFLNVSTNKVMKYEYSQSGANDVVSKMPVLVCQLSVTRTEIQKDEHDEDIEVTIRKFCVERLDGGAAIHAWTGLTGQNTFEWLTIDEINTYNQNHPNGQIAPTFTIGIDPKIDDFIIGQEFKISNSVDWHLNLDKTGMAIPIHTQDLLSGTIDFKIVSPYNIQWDQYNIYPAGWFLGREIFRANSRSILNNIQSIMLSDLKIEMTSNNGGISRSKSGADNDLVYYSDMDQKYIEKQEDEVTICSCLTPEEYSEYGIKMEQSNSFITYEDNSAFYGWELGEENHYWLRPEECYVDYMYKEYSTPARILDTQLSTRAFTYNGLYGNSLSYDMLSHYFSGIPVVGDCRLMSYTSDLKYKTIDCRFRQHRTIENEQIPEE